MIDWNKALETKPRGYGNVPHNVTHIMAFDYDTQRVHMLQFFSPAMGKAVTFFRTDGNKPIQLGCNIFWCSGVVVQNKVERLHKSVYTDGTIDDDWYDESCRVPEDDDEVGVFWKIGEEITYESLV